MKMGEKKMPTIAEIGPNQAGDSGITIIFNQIGRITFLKLRKLIETKLENPEEQMIVIMAGRNPSQIHIKNNPNIREILNEISTSNLELKFKEQNGKEIVEIKQPIQSFVKDTQRCEK